MDGWMDDGGGAVNQDDNDNDGDDNDSNEGTTTHERRDARRIQEQSNPEPNKTHHHVVRQSRCTNSSIRFFRILDLENDDSKDSAFVRVGWLDDHGMNKDNADDPNRSCAQWRR